MKNPLVPVGKLAIRFAALNLETETNDIISIKNGQARLASGPEGSIVSMSLVDQTTLPASTFSKAKSAGAGAAIGLLFSPLGAAIGAAAGAAMSKGQSVFRVAIQVDGWPPIYVQIPGSKARALEIVAQRPIV